VALRELAVDLHQLQRDDREAFALEPRDHLACELAVEGIRLYEDERAIH
jgi:hypothetical protein